METKTNPATEVALEIRDLRVRFDTDDARVYAVNGVNHIADHESSLFCG